MSVVVRSEVNRPQQTHIHPGWLARPRSSVEILALKLGVPLPRLIHDFGTSLNTLIEETLAHSRASGTQRYLKYLDEREGRELAAAAAERESVEIPSLLEVPTESVSPTSIRKQAGFSEFLSWYNTDDWGCDEWFGLSTVAEPEDVRLRRWMDTLLNGTPEQEQSGTYVFLDADSFALSDEELEFSE